MLAAPVAVSVDAKHGSGRLHQLQLGRLVVDHPAQILGKVGAEPRVDVPTHDAWTAHPGSISMQDRISTLRTSRELAA